MPRKKTQKTIRPWPLSLLPQPLIPEAVRIFMARRVVDAVALGMMIFALWGLMALVTYSPSDPAWNVASIQADEVDNWMGRRGAIFADMTVQTIGLGILGAMLAIGVMGWRLLKRRETNLPFAIRLMFLIGGTFLLAGAFARVPVPDGWSASLYFGGVIGAKILDLVTNIIPHYVVGAFLCAGLALPSLAASIGYPWDRWKAAFAAMFHLLATLAGKAEQAKGWVDHYDALGDSSSSSSLSFKSIKLPRRKSSLPLVSQDDIEPVTAPAKEITPTQQTFEPQVVTPLKVEKTGMQSTMAFNARDAEDWEFPPLDLLQEAPPPSEAERPDEQALQRNAMMLQQVLQDFSVQGEIVKIHPGPVVTLYELEPAPGTKSSRVIGLADDIARSMSAVSVRAAVVPGRNVIGIEIPNKKRSIVYMRDILSSHEYAQTKAKLPIVLGKDIGGSPIIADLAKMPHLLVAGTTGSGKSVAVNVMLMSLLYHLPPEKCRFIMIDPKMLELSAYNDIPHLLSPVVTEPGKAIVALKWAVHEMEDRYRAMSKLGVRNIDGYNARIAQARKKGEMLSRKVQTGFDHDTGKPVYEEQPIELVDLPYIVIIVDEFADLMLVAGKDVENAIQRLAQMARAAGIHIIMATQRPSVDVITGVIKANFPTRISFQVTSKIDSRTILGEGGAEQLLGMGDMLFMAGGGQIKRVHGPFVADDEVGEVVTHLKGQASPDYLETVMDGDGSSSGEGTNLFDGFGAANDEEKVDELYDQAVAIIAREGKASTSFIQRHLQIGYNRAARIIEEMERQKVVSPANATGKREILIGER